MQGAGAQSLSPELTTLVGEVMTAIGSGMPVWEIRQKVETISPGLADQAIVAAFDELARSGEWSEEVVRGVALTMAQAAYRTALASGKTSDALKAVELIRSL